MKGLILSKIKDFNRREKLKKFFRLLKENGLFFEFFRILKSCPPGTFQTIYKSNMVYFFNTCPISCWTMDCFTWIDYNERCLGWSIIHSKWNHTLKKIKVKK